MVHGWWPIVLDGAPQSSGVQNDLHSMYLIERKSYTASWLVGKVIEQERPLGVGSAIWCCEVLTGCVWAELVSFRTEFGYRVWERFRGFRASRGLSPVLVFEALVLRV
ncbi:hypothetical protein M758_UG255600 [Ceratodon purpureus]|nr:hypothetical protein M758_UG255600 [Ceratodon purpureus]